MTADEYLASLPYREATWHDVAMAYGAGQMDGQRAMHTLAAKLREENATLRAALARANAEAERLRDLGKQLREAAGEPNCHLRALEVIQKAESDLVTLKAELENVQARPRITKGVAITTEEYLATLPLREPTWHDVKVAFEAGKRDRESTPCHWREDVDGVWETDCEQAFVLDSGTPAEHSMKFCGYCGHPLKEMLYQEDER